MSYSKIDIHGILDRAGANPDAPDGSQAWALAQVDAAVAELIKASAKVIDEHYARGSHNDSMIELGLIIERIGSDA